MTASKVRQGPTQRLTVLPKIARGAMADRRSTGRNEMVLIRLLLFLGFR
jgi:hypothetical protein